VKNLIVGRAGREVRRAPSSRGLGPRMIAAPRPAVVMVADGRGQVIIARETWDDVLCLQRPLTDAAVALD
jgi:hypothetical protein